MSKVKFVKIDEDFQLIAKMDAIAFPTDLPIEGWEETHWWVGYVDGKPACYCGLSKINRSTGYLKRAGVLPKFRGRGLQVKMIRKRIAYAKKLRLRSIVTDTSVSNFISSNNLIKCKFRIFMPTTPWTEDTQICWLLNLT